ncbi:MAG: hypothetical protein OEW19_06570, partial [Acidobacteriota bacterium]|nr:hypothetical protein [Acidobacteriota bacterium]
MTPTAFAREIVDRLETILPGGFAARADGDTIVIDPPDHVLSSTSLSHIDPDDDDPENYASAAWNVLSMAQDLVNETSGDPWPAGLGPGTDLAEPGTRADGQTIHMW